MGGSRSGLGGGGPAAVVDLVMETDGLLPVVPPPPRPGLAPREGDKLGAEPGGPRKGEGSERRGPWVGEPPCWATSWGR